MRNAIPENSDHVDFDPSRVQIIEQHSISIGPFMIQKENAPLSSSPRRLPSGVCFANAFSVSKHHDVRK